MNELRDMLTSIDSIVIAMYSLYFLMLIIVSMVIYLISYYVDIEQTEEAKKEFDINIATVALEKFDEQPKEFVLDDYEKQQEQNAIISYDELLEQTMSMPAILTEEIEKNENYNEEFAPISMEELDNQKNDSNALKISEEELEEELSVTKEMAYLQNLKEFRANLK